MGKISALIALFECEQMSTLQRAIKQVQIRIEGEGESEWRHQMRRGDYTQSKLMNGCQINSQEKETMKNVEKTKSTSLQKVKALT